MPTLTQRAAEVKNSVAILGSHPKPEGMQQHRPALCLVAYWVLEQGDFLRKSQIRRLGLPQGADPAT